MQCPECRTFKRGDNCVKCYLRARKRLGLFTRALKRVAQRYLRISNAHRRLLEDLAQIRKVKKELREDLLLILENTSYLRVGEKIRARIGRD